MRNQRIARSGRKRETQTPQATRGSASIAFIASGSDSPGTSIHPRRTGVSRRCTSQTERFTAYYDGNVAGCAAWLRDAITAHAR